MAFHECRDELRRVDVLLEDDGAYGVFLVKGNPEDKRRFVRVKSKTPMLDPAVGDSLRSARAFG
jgi:hypothetical protein